MPFFDPIRIGASGAAADYEVQRSLRFDDDQSSPTRLQRTIQSGGNKNKWTLSVWVKRSQLGDPDYTNSLGGNDGQMIIHAAGNGNRGLIKFKSDDTLSFEQGTDGGYSAGRITTTAVFRDVGAWYHLCFVADYANSTTADRAKIFVNGVQQEVTTNVTFLDGSASDDCIINRDRNHELGFAEYALGFTGSSYWFNFFCGYMAEYYFIDGQAYDPTYFTETNATTGQLVPKKYTGGFGTTGWYLDFLDNSGVTATTLGKDSSGNSNNWTPGGFSVSDSVTDTPTKNFCTLNPLNATNDVDLRKGNLEFFQSSNDESATATFGITSGKWYWEVYKNSGENPELGIDTLVKVLSNKSDDVSNTKVAFITNGGNQRNGAGSSISLTGSSSGQTGAGVIAIAVDFDNKKIWYSDLSGNFFNSGNPASGSNAALDFSSVAVANGCVPYVFIGTGGNNSCNVNFGQDGTFAGHTTAGGYADGNGHGNFKYSVPSGYLALCSANLPDPAILLPNEYFDTVLYSGNASSQTISIPEFTPDWVWIKKRSGGSARSHQLYDQVRGATKLLHSDDTQGEQTASNGLTSFGTKNFAVGSDDGINGSGGTYVAWNWNAGGSTVTNNNGSLSAQVRAQTSAGFSIASWTSTGTTGSTIGHGLGVKPDCIILKGRDTSSSQPWRVYHSYLGATKSLMLDATDAAATQTGVWNDTEPTSSVFTVGSFGSVNENTKKYIAYCFSEVAGFSKFGGYTGNGNANGTFVFTGFRVSWLMVKKSSSGDSWLIMDNKRDVDNVVGNTLAANSSGAENADTGGIPTDFLSNGFKCRGSGGDFNANGETFVYLAFAESPFRNARAR